MTPARLPTSTYRLQLRTPRSDPRGIGFTFQHAIEIVDRLAGLGVGAIYLSPILKATQGSTHGYDVVDPRLIDSELGGINGLRSLRRAARRAGMGVVVDIVPNHLGVGDAAQNPLWWEALRDGPEGEKWKYFDFDSDPRNGAGGKIALPVLGSVDDLSALTIGNRSDKCDEPALCFYEHRFPIAPGTYEPAAAASSVSIADGASGAQYAQEVHQRQHYRLVPWREPLLGYRRFFTVTQLAGVRQEDPAVFAASHSAIAQWINEDLIDGLRVDHPDGLADPVSYCQKLRELIGPDRWLIVEKILGPGELLDPATGADGTSGYDALRLIDGVLIDRSGQLALSELCESYTGNRGDAESIAAESTSITTTILLNDLRPELNRVVRSVINDSRPVDQGVEPADGHLSADVDSVAIRTAIIDLVAATPYYRADYPQLAGTLPAILDHLAAAVPRADTPTINALAAALALHGESSRRLAQLTGAATAKTLEDRLYYRTARLVSLNEVGGEPQEFGLSLAAFHQSMGERARLWPTAMSTMNTHDTKRSADVRARISLLSQHPSQWKSLVESVENTVWMPDRASCYFLLQVIVGAWPPSLSWGALDSPDAEAVEDFRARLKQYATKALREAAQETRWTDVNENFETEIHDWITAITTADGDGSAAASIANFVSTHADADRETILAATALHLLSPGVPDIYQGTERPDDSLVDPDNRRFVDHEALKTASENEKNHAIGDLNASCHPLSKIALVRSCLSLRQQRPAVFGPGSSYQPVLARGPQTDRLIAFVRDSPTTQVSTAISDTSLGTDAVVVLIRRHSAACSLAELAGTTLALPPGQWVNFLNGSVLPQELDTAELFVDEPVVFAVRA